MHQGASGLDGTSKKWIHPLRTALIPIMAALFSYVYLHGATLSAWSLTVIVSLEKKSSGAAGNVMDGYRTMQCKLLFRPRLLVFVPQLFRNGPIGPGKGTFF